MENRLYKESLSAKTCSWRIAALVFPAAASTPSPPYRKQSKNLPAACLSASIAKPEMLYPGVTALKSTRPQGAATLRKAEQDTPSLVLL
jgi:hypothetical protein